MSEYIGGGTRKDGSPKLDGARSRALHALIRGIRWSGVKPGDLPLLPRLSEEAYLDMAAQMTDGELLRFTNLGPASLRWLRAQRPPGGPIVRRCPTCGHPIDQNMRLAE